MSRLTIPPEAPFTGAQKMWLKGFLDGLSSSLAPPQESPAPAISNQSPVTILWGSQTGNSEALAKKLAKHLTTGGHPVTLLDMAEVTPLALAKWENVLIITSTYGDGEPPDNAASLHAALAATDSPLLDTLGFAVFALGDSNYPGFCKCGHDFDSRLSALGAKRLLLIHEADVEFDEPFATWSAKVGETLRSLVPA